MTIHGVECSVLPSVKLTMAKKGGVQQLQTEINTNEELIKFLDRDGLIVLDVYTEWCGPCLAMIGSLKKIKLEQGGDDLHLAVVKCDRIDALARFRNKSEPTWLLASKGKLVNCAFGANVPHLVELILKELDIERRTRDTDPETSGRNYYELQELTPIERTRFNVIQKLEEENERIEIESEHRRRMDYLTFVTDEIMKNANDMGVTILMPHVISRDLLKRLTEPADKCHLVAKDKKNAQILNEHIEMLALFTTDLMSRYLVDHILNRDVFAVCWKLTDGQSDKNVEEHLNSFVHLVWNEEDESSSTLKGIKIAVETEAETDDIVMEEESSKELPIEESKEEQKLETTTERETEVEGNENPNVVATEEQEKVENTEVNVTEGSDENTAENGQETPKESKNGEKPNNIEEKKASERTTPITPIALFTTKNYIEVNIPPIWTPIDKRTNAALIYLYFRSLTETYLPPDPPVERPHLAIIFDAYKRREIMDMVDQYRDDVLAYGYFTTDNCETAQLIANSTFNYHKNPPTIYDKCILKVAKTRNSPLITGLKALGPSYISMNTEVGKTECLVFFPPGYKNSSETGETTPVPVDEIHKKKKKKKRKAKHDSDEENEIENSQEVKNVAQAPADGVDTTEEPEDGTELDDEDSADDDDSANEPNETENVAETTET